jgi:multiple sugar transport system substrate-binding protein
MKRLVLLLIVLAVAAGSTFGGGQDETAMAEKIELRYMMWDPQIIEKEQALADKFSQEHPNVTITIESAAFAQFWEKMQAMAAAKNMPDVFWMSSGFVKDYARLGAILNIEDRVNKLDQSQFFPSAFGVLRAPTFEGDMYSFPWAVVTCISYYNKRIFDEGGVAYPNNDWTWDQLRATAKKLSKDSDGDGAYDQWGYWVKGRYTHMYPYVYNNGVPSGPISSDFKSFLGASGKGRDAFKFLTDLVVVDKTSPTPAQTKGVSTFFTTGKIAMCTEGSWRIATYRKGLDDPFGIFLTPKGPGSPGKHVVYGWADAMSISAYTDHPDAAWDWMIFMSGPGRPIDSILGGKVPIWKANATSDVWLEKDQLPENKQLVLDSVDLIGKEVTMAPLYNEWNAAVQSDFEKISLGEGDFDAVMSELKDKVEKILARAQ